MKKSVFLFIMMAILSVGAIAYGCIFVNSHTSKAVLTEETISGDRDAADGLVVRFQADAGDGLHWFNRFEYGSDKTESVFKRGEILETAETSVYDNIRREDAFVGTMLETVETSLYDDIRFTGWSTEPFTTKLDYGELAGMQEKKLHDFYDEIQQKVVESGRTEAGTIRLGDYLDYYPVSFRFQFGTTRYDSANALTGLKIYDEQGMLSAETGAVYDKDVALYTAFNAMFRIPVIDNEYQEYRVTGKEDYDPETSLGYTMDVEKPFGAGEDYYEFDPIMVIQEESGKSGKTWEHPDLADAQDAMKNRMLFIVNNRTAKGAPVDVSQIRGGYGIYELPVALDTKAKKIGHRVVAVPDPTPLPDQMAMVYPLDEAAEYVELSLCGDHRYLAVFSVKEDRYFVELVDADTWTSDGPVELFRASEEMTYSWGEDGSLAVTNHQDDVAVLSRAENADRSQAEPFDEPQTEPLHETYKLIYHGKAPEGFDKVFFDREMIHKKHSYAKHQYGVDAGLAVAAKDGKIALVQNQPLHLSETAVRNASLECAVIDETGVIYRGRINSNLVDVGVDMRTEESRAVDALLSGAASKVVNRMIQPVRSENRAQWKTP